MPRRIAAIAALGIAFAAGALVGRGVVGEATGPDRVLATGFGHALATSDTTWTSTPRNVWLSSLSSPPLTVGRTLSVGDRITITAKSGKPQVIKVTALEQVDGAAVGLDGLRLQLVTAQGAANATHAAAPVRFLFVIDTPGETPAPATTRSGTHGRVL